MEMHLTETDLQNYILMEIEKILLQSDKSLKDFEDMPSPNHNILKAMRNSLIAEERKYNVSEEDDKHQRLLQSLNEEQREVYNDVIKLKKEKFSFYRALEEQEKRLSTKQLSVNKGHKERLFFLLLHQELLLHYSQEEEQHIHDLKYL